MAWRQHAAIRSHGEHFPVDKTIGTPPPESADRIREDYAEYFKAVVKACAIFRLAADPFPILRSDPQCEHRFPDCITPEFSQSFIGNCLGNNFVESITLRRIITAIG